VALLAAGQVTDSPYGRVVGQVSEQGSNRPVANARVNVFSMARPPANLMRSFDTTTDADGRFALERVPPGEYRVEASKAGYALQTPGAGPPIIDVSAGRTSDQISLTLTRGGAIAGRVVNAAGEPEPEVSVMAYARIPNGPPAAPLVINGRPAQTDDLGDYRIYGLAPGEYYIQVSPRPVGGLFNVSPPHASVTVPTYYPEGRTFDEAQRVAVTAGETTRDVDIRLITAPAFQISGTVLDESGSPVTGAAVSVMIDRNPSRGVPFAFGPPTSTLTNADGSFTLTNLPPGIYRVSAGFPMTGGPFLGAGGFGVVAATGSATTSAGFTTWTATTPPNGFGANTTEQVTIADANVDGIKLVVRRPQ